MNGHAAERDELDQRDERDELGVRDADWDQKFLPPPLRLDNTERALKISRLLSGLVLGGAALRRVEAVFERELAAGLASQPSSLQCENTYVPELPDGTEEGVFLALDLGGTNFRVLLLQLSVGQVTRERVRQYHISDELRLGAGLHLFEFLAECVHDFLKHEGLEHEQLPLGFTFSFPMRQHSISSGELITWTKSFKCGGMERVDVAALLQRCLQARGLRVTVQVLLNDTTGTLVAGAQADQDVVIGFILGTGSNGCYMERASRVSHWEVAHAQVRDVCVDVEWGAFGDNGCLDFIRTDIDDEVDANSLLVRSFTFEKYIGGKYLGALAAAALSRLAAAGLAPTAPSLDNLTTAHLSLFEEENESGGWERTAAVLNELTGTAWSDSDARVAQWVARVVSNRAAQLVAVCVAVLLRRVARRGEAAVAADGSVYRRHPRLRALLERYVALLAPRRAFRLLPADDGSGRGAALAAAIAARVAAREA